MLWSEADLVRNCLSTQQAIQANLTLFAIDSAFDKDNRKKFIKLINEMTDANQ